MSDSPTQAYEDRVVLIVFALATATYLVIGIRQPFWPGILASAVMVGALIMLIRIRGTTRLSQTWWATLGAVAMPASLLVYALVDATQSGMTRNHWLAVIVMSVCIAAFVVPHARLPRMSNRNRP